MKKIAALYVIKNGPYYGLNNVEPWGLPDRDARDYNGPYPVIAHPPCERWGRYWSGGPMLANTPNRKKLGDDDGCFRKALECVRKFGGVLEHPEASKAWQVFGLIAPPCDGGWIAAGDWQGWTCCVEQGHYGHLSRKKTWLYVCGVKDLPSLKWGKSEANFKFEDSYHTKEERRKAQRLGVVSRLSAKQRKETPTLFREVLIQIAQSVY